MGKSSCGETSLGKSSCGETLFHEKLFEGKVLRQNFLRKLIGKTSAPKTSIAEKVPGRKVSRGKLFCGRLLSRKTSTGISSHPQKLSGTEKRGTVPEKIEFGWCLFLDNDDFEDTRDTPPDSIIQRKSPQRLRTLLRSRKTSSRKTYLPENLASGKLIFRKTSSARRQSPC